MHNSKEEMLNLLQKQHEKQGFCKCKIKISKILGQFLLNSFSNQNRENPIFFNGKF